MNAVKLHRGEWRIDDRADGFTLLVRPRIGPLSCVSAIWVLAWCAFALANLLLAALAAQQSDWQWVASSLALGALCSVFGGAAIIGSAWLAFGHTELRVDDERCTLHRVGLRFAKPVEFRKADLKTLAVDPHWTAKGLHLLYNQLGHLPDRGPLQVSTWDGFTHHFGGNVDLRSADEIRIAVSARTDCPSRAD